MGIPRRLLRPESSRPRPRLAEAIATGGGTSKVLIDKLADRETELRDARAALEHLDGLMVEAKAFDTKEWLAEVYAIVGDLQETLDAKNPQRGRQALKQLLTVPVTIKPGVGEDGEPT